jgi:hypothetical protein
MLYLAATFGYPVSTTHDIVDSIMGFSIAARGFDFVKWEEPEYIPTCVFVLDISAVSDRWYRNQCLLRSVQSRRQFQILPRGP